MVHFMMIIYQILREDNNIIQLNFTNLSSPMARSFDDLT